MLVELRTFRSVCLQTADNPFVVNCDGRGTPHRWIALRTIWSLVTLDDLDVDEHERENATRFVDKLPRSARDSLAKTLNWKVVGSSPGLPDITRRIQELYWSVYWHRYSLDRAGR